MSDLRRIANHLDDAYTHEELASGLARIERRLERRRAFRRGAWVTTVACGIALALAAYARGPRAVEPLTRADGRALAAIAEETVRLSDGSSITVAAASDLALIDQSAETIAFRLRRGSAHFEVRPGGPRRWSVDAGLVRVEVLGTSFTVAREASFASVAVHRGVVAITTANETRRLYAGERFEIGERSEPVGVLARPAPRGETSSAPASPIDAPVVAHERAASAPSHPASDHASQAEGLDRERAARAHGRREPDPSMQAEADGTEPFDTASSTPAVPIAALLSEADQARSEGRVDDAIHALWAIVDAHPRASEASSAAVSAARLEQQRGHHEAAIAAYQRALGLGPSPALAELCYEALVSCHLARSDRAAAERTAAEYRRRFPSGTRTEAIEALLGRR